MAHGKSPGFVRGGYWAECDRCGEEYRNTEMQLEWTGLFVCKKDCWEPRHPQDFVRGKSDRIVPSGPLRPAKNEYTKTYTDVGGNASTDFSDRPVVSDNRVPAGTFQRSGVELIKDPNLADIHNNWFLTGTDWDISSTPGRISATFSSSVNQFLQHASQSPGTTAPRNYFIFKAATYIITIKFVSLTFSAGGLIITPHQGNFNANPTLDSMPANNTWTSEVTWSPASESFPERHGCFRLSTNSTTTGSVVIESISVREKDATISQD